MSSPSHAALRPTGLCHRSTPAARKHRLPPPAARAVELFVQTLVEKSCQVAAARQGKTVNASHL
jgi:hypothetical protein